MTSSPVRRRPRGWYLVPLLLLALLLAGAPAAAWPRGGHELTVMTRNVYLGAALDPLFPQPPIDTTEELVAAATQVWHQVLATDFATRAEALAAEIAAAEPMLVGLQEVTLYRVDPLDPSTEATTVRLDFLAVLQEELAELGQRYRVEAVQEAFDGEVPALDWPASAGGTGQLVDVRLTDRDVILVRQQGGAKVVDSASGVFQAALELPVLGQPLRIERGWTAVDVRFRGRVLRFINTHLEAFHPGITALQAGELLAGPAATSLPVVLVGDFNSPPEPLPFSAAYALIAAAGFTDVAVGGLPTCCFDADVADPAAPLTTRIDLIWYRGPFTALDVDRIGDEPIRDTPPVWASDHAGLVAVLLGTKT